MTAALPADIDTDLAAWLGALRVGPTVLAPGGDGPLTGLTCVVKDLVDVAGVATGAGVPDRLAEARPATAHAAVVTRLVDAGAAVIGKAHTDELAFSLSGTNVHYGTPRNPAAPGHVPGGSSSGSASAVAGGLVPFAVGTDTGGSIRVPASYCGVVGFRPTHGRAPAQGIVALAPSFDTAGILARTGPLAEAAGLALLGGVSHALPPSGLVLAEDLLAEADADVADAVSMAASDLAASLGVSLRPADLTAGRLDAWVEAFRACQLVEAWGQHGSWITRRRPGLGPGVAARFEAARSAPRAGASGAVPAGVETRRRLASVLRPGEALILPSAATPAPPCELTGPAKADIRTRTLRLTCLAPLGRLPAVSLPLASVGGLPVGVGLLARRHDDERLLALARRVVR